MANPVWHVRLGIRLDLERADLGHPDRPGLWERLYSQDREYARRGVPVSRRGLRCAGICMDKGVIAWMHLRQRRNGRREAVHEHAEDQKRHTVPESDEHKAYKERIHRVAETAGHRAEVEYVPPGRRIRTDVLVHGAGGLRFGWEIQRSDISAAAIRGRVRAARQHGIVPAWHTDRRTFEGRYETRWTRTDDVPWEIVLNRPDLMVRSGIRRIHLERCGASPIPCPDHRPGCERVHPRTEPVSVGFDAMVRDIAAGELTPVDYRIPRSRTHRFWATRTDAERYLDFLGGRITDDERHPPGHAGRNRPTCRPQAQTVTLPFPEEDTHVLGEPTTPVPLPSPRRPATAAAPPWRAGLRGVCGAGPGPCGKTPAGFYAAGWRCAEHTPSALAGRPEPPPGPGWPVHRRDREPES